MDILVQTNFNLLNTKAKIKISLRYFKFRYYTILIEYMDLF